MALNNNLIEIEQSFGEKIPPDIAYILVESGFDTKTSLLNIDANTIMEIEEFINNHRQILDKTSFDSTQIFRFRPGHKKFILNLSAYLSNQFESKDFVKNVQENDGYNDFSYILKSLIGVAKLNAGRDSKGFRYNESIRYFATYIYLLCGKACYEALSANLPIPQANTILGYIGKQKVKIIEGELRCNELVHYLKSLNAEKVVWLSEDATGIVAKIEFDPQSNQMIGLVLPINSTTGLPMPFSFLARSANEIKYNIDKKAKSSLVYIVMAQPLIPKAPPFLLQMFGTDNKFKTQDVLFRWRHTVQELERCGIKVAGFSSDGDNRLLKSMQYNSKLDSITINNQWFSDNDSDICFLQDIVHIGTKLRNRLLKQSILLPIGNKVASVSHLKILLNSTSKDVHGLVYSDICPDDRQNYDSLKKIMRSNVREALNEHIFDSEATVEYIRICYEITSSLYEEDLSPIERISRIWRSTFFLRIWRLSVVKKPSKGLKVSKNFITQNAYACIELNARNLVILIKRFRIQNLGKNFIPTLFNSQPCEETFRKLRSMGTIDYTKINFTLLELMHLVGRVELMNDIIFFKLAGLKVEFPRNRVNDSMFNDFELPSDVEIENAIKLAKMNALGDAQKFGLNIAPADIDICLLSDAQIDLEERETSDIANAEYEGSDMVIECKSLKDYGKERENLNEKSPFVKVNSSHGSKIVRKSSLMWLFSDSKERLSSDRLRRVQGASKGKNVRRKLEFIDADAVNNCIRQSDEICIGDWCILREQLGDIQNPEYRLLLGLVISFQYIQGKTEKEKQYLFDFVSTNVEKKSRGIEVLARWYEIHENGKINTLKEDNCSFMNIKLYVGTMATTAINKDGDEHICISKNVFNIVEKELENLKQIK